MGPFLNPLYALLMRSRAQSAEDRAKRMNILAHHHQNKADALAEKAARHQALATHFASQAKADRSLAAMTVCDRNLA